MTWFKVDDNFALNPKALAAGNAALGLWVRAGSWSMQQLTNGYVPDAMVKTLGSKASAKALERAGLWDRGDGGWHFHNWLRYQPSREDVEGRRAKATEKKRHQRATGTRNVYHDDTGRFASPGDNEGDSPRDSPGPSPATRPDPTRPMSDSQSVVVSDTPARPADDDPRPAIAQARGKRLHHGRDMPPKWIEKTAQKLDLARIRELEANGLSPAAIDLELDPSTSAPAVAVARSGPCGIERCGGRWEDPGHDRRHAEAQADDPLLLA